MNKKLNVLVTGCGGDIGQSIGKILKECELFESIFGTDLNLNHAGIMIFDECFILPKCNSSIYLDSLKKLIKNYSIDLLIPVSEAEIRFFYEENISEDQLGTKLIIANRAALSIGLDKLRTSEFLKENNLVYPHTSLISNSLDIKLPCIIKSRNGSGSKNIFLAKDEIDLNYLKLKFPDFIAQEYLENASEEYTCGLFRTQKGETRSLIFRRTLLGGFSGYGEVITNDSIEILLNTIAEKINLIGSINVQLRISPEGPCIFEINPRFSSTVRFRDLMGFRDVIWSVQDKLGLIVQTYAPVQSGKKFYKGFNEYIS
jgi:carbamoyl-phosphate synthase large subunit